MFFLNVIGHYQGDNGFVQVVEVSDANTTEYFLQAHAMVDNIPERTVSKKFDDLDSAMDLFSAFWKEER